MAQVLLRSFIPGYLRQLAGKAVFVRPHANRVVKRQEESAPRHASLPELSQWAASLGVELEVSERPDAVLLHDIGRVKGEKGAGAKVIRALGEYADARGKGVALEALYDNPKLIEYYRRLGFKPDASKAPIDNDGLLMWRTPQAMAKALLLFFPSDSLGPGQVVTAGSRH